jgi:hypothetical protein
MMTLKAGQIIIILDEPTPTSIIIIARLHSHGFGR